MNSNGILGGLGSFLVGLGTIVTVFSIIYALVQCYFGYPIFRVMIVIQGVLIGIVTGIVIGALSGMVPLAFILPIVLGILFGILANVLHKVGVFFYFLALFGLITYAITLVASGNPTAGLTAAIIAGIIAGIIGVIFERYFVIFSTAICGGFTAGFSIGSFVRNGLALSIILGVVFAVTGILVQFKLTKKKSEYNQNAAKNLALQQAYATPMPQAIQYQSFGQPAPMTRFCGMCGTANSAGAAFCFSCGQPMNVQPAPAQSAPAQPAPAQPAPANIFCEACGAKNEADAKFCSCCGKPFEQASPTSFFN